MRGWLSVRSWSLRRRLLAATLGLAVLGLAATAVTATVLLRSYLVHQVDQQLRTGLAAVARAPGERPRPPRPPAQDAQQLPTPFVFTQLDAAGRVVRQFGGSLQQGRAGPDLSAVTLAAVRARGGAPFKVPSADGRSSFRVRGVVRSDGTGSDTVAVSLHSVDSTVHRLELVIGLVALGVLVLLAALGTAAVRLGLRPLTDVERTAGHIARGDLSRRVRDAPAATEIGRLSEALNGMLSQIEVAFAAREASETTLRQFVADASHELRTPLTTVRGYAELVRRGALPDEAARLQAAGRIEAEVTRMGRLVDDLLLLAHLDQQRPLHFGDVDLAALTADAVADARVRDPERPVSYATPPAPMCVRADADRLRQVLANLLGNALVHTPAGTPVEVGLTGAAGWVTLTVSDRGPGMAPEVAGRVFERFYRADVSRSRAHGGSGLGLAIVDAVVRAGGGSVSCASAPAVGTTFTVTLPAPG